MKYRSRTLITIVLLSLWLAAPAAVTAGAPAKGPARAPVARPEQQADSPAWIIWETEAPVQRLALAGDSLWVGHEEAGLTRWDLETGPIRFFSGSDGLPGEDVLAIAVDGSGDTWVALLDGSLARSTDGASFADLSPPTPADDNAWSLDVAGGEVLLGTLGGGVARRSGGSWSVDTTADSSLPFDDIYAAALQANGTPWIGTLGYGVAAKQAGVWTTYDPPLSIANPLDPSAQVNNRAITDIAIDASGAKWFASDGSGVAVLNTSNDGWSTYNTGNSGLSSDFVQSIFLDSAGHRWFGTLGGGVSRLSSGGGWTSYHRNNSPLPEDDVLDVVVDDNGGLWLAAYDAGLAFFGDLPTTPPSFELNPLEQPNFIPGASRGYYLWLDPDTYHWTLAWSGDGRSHSFKGFIESDGPMTLIETALEADDSASLEGNRLTIDANESSGQDQVTFELDRSATELTIALKIDGAYYPFSIQVGAAKATPGTAPFRLAAPQPQPPTVEAGEDLSLTEGDFAFFSGSYSDPDSPSGHSIEWNLGDGTTIIDKLSPTHQYLDDGIYTAELTLTDVHGTASTDSLTVSVENAPPEVDMFTEPFQPAVGETVVFEALIFDPGELDTHTYTWDFGDGTEKVTSNVPTVEQTYQVKGDYEVSVTVTDDDGGVGEAGFTLTVLGNQPPQVSAGDDAEVEEGTSFERAIDFDDPDSEAWTAEVNWGDGSAPETIELTSADPLSIRHPYADDGTYTVEVTVIDDLDAAGSDSFEVTVTNVAPEVNLPAADPIDEGSALTAIGTFSDPGADTWTATVDYGEGEGPVPLTLDSIEKLFELNHTYVEDGEYSVEVCVTDDDDGVGCDALTLTVNNVAPTVNAGPDQTVNEGEVLSFAPTFVDPGADEWTAAVDWGDGTSEAPPVDETNKSLDLQHAYGDDGTYTVEVCVRDDDGGEGCDQVVVTVNNVAPSVDAGSDQTVDEGDPVTVEAAFDDPGFLDTHAATIDWDDGGDPQPMAITESDGEGTASAQHAYRDNGVYTVLVEVCDDDAACTTDELTVTVENVAPSVSAQGDQIDEGQTAILQADFTDPGLADTHTAVVDWGDGNSGEVAVSQQAGGGSLSASHVYGDNGDYAITVTVTDDDGASGSDQATVEVANLDPSLELDTADALEIQGELTFLGRRGQEQSHSASATDPGSDDLTFTWQLGPSEASQSTYFNNGASSDPALSPDGTFPFSANDQATVTFDQPGIFSIEVMVHDDDGGSAAESMPKLVTGEAVCSRSQGYWQHQFSGKGKQHIDDETLLAYLEIVNHYSDYFSEVRSLSSIEEAKEIFDVSGPSMRSKAEAQLLAAWLNFANGAVDWNQQIDTGDDPLGTASYSQVIQTAEAILLDAEADHQQLERAKDLAETVNHLDKENSSCDVADDEGDDQDNQDEDEDGDEGDGPPGGGPPGEGPPGKRGQLILKKPLLN
ncbi:MAG: PKD domain-containing protein [Anaerolineales bacterium]